MDVAEFLTARYDKEQQLAEEAIEEGSHRWKATRGHGGPRVETGGEHWTKDVNLGVWACDDPADDCESLRQTWMRQAEFVARHDPTWVLADLEAKRAIIETCRQMSIYSSDSPAQDAHADVILRALVAPYVGHPDYDSAWDVGPAE